MRSSHRQGHAVTIDKRVLRQFVSFASVGVVATALQYVVLIVAVEWLHRDSVFGSCAGFALSAVCNYWLNYHFTFRSRQSHAIAGCRFVIVAAGGLALNAGFMGLMVDALKWPYLIAQLVTMVPVVLWNFSCNRLWSFAGSPIAGERK
jgi:putative flippase GtrA